LFVVIENHFREEEEFLEKYDLKGLSIQQKQHQIFKTLLREKMNVSDEDLFRSLRELKVFTIQWWCKHINEFDYKTVSFYNTSSDIIDHSSTVEDVIWMMVTFSKKELNDKHHNILRILEDLYKLNISPKENKQKIEVSRNSFFTCMKELFKYEEKLMKDNGSPNFEQHQRIHKGLIRKYESYFDQVDEGKAVFSIYLRNRLYKSWIRHTNEIDAETFGDMNDEQ
jgi:hemerythrin-like metal-binding protein